MNIVQNPQLLCTEVRYKSVGRKCGPGLLSMSPVASRKIFGAQVYSSGVVSGLYI